MSNRHVHPAFRGALAAACSGTAIMNAAQAREDADAAYSHALEAANIEAHAEFKASDEGFDPVCERMLDGYNAMRSALRAFVNGDSAQLQAIADAAMDREADAAALRKVEEWRKAA